jgi:hypothetical protein
MFLTPTSIKQDSHARLSRQSAEYKARNLQILYFNATIFHHKVLINLTIIVLPKPFNNKKLGVCLLQGVGKI